MYKDSSKWSKKIRIYWSIVVLVYMVISKSVSRIYSSIYVTIVIKYYILYTLNLFIFRHIWDIQFDFIYLVLWIFCFPTNPEIRGAGFYSAMWFVATWKKPDSTARYSKAVQIELFIIRKVGLIIVSGPFRSVLV